MMDSLGTDEYISYIVSKYAQLLFKVAYSALHNRDDAQDTVQEVFIKLIEKRPNFNDEEHEKAWLIRVTINLSRNLLKKHKREYGSDLSFIKDEAYTAKNDEDILEAVMSLDEKYSTVIHLFYYEEMSISQIAQTLRIPSATVGTRLSRGRTALKKILKGDYEL